MKDAGLPNSTAPGRLFDVTDAQLSAELKKWTGTAPALHPVGELLDRHWEAAYVYARLCTDGPRSAGMLTTAAFTRLFGESLRHNGPTAAWRPQILVTVRRIAAEWDTDRRREQLHPELRSESGHGERASARLLPPAGRRLLSGAFQRLPQSARALLWHSEVEGEPLEIPGALLGLDEEDVRVELGRARERLREECLQVHRELAPEQECRSFLRMLDVTYRRGGIDVDPDLRAHLDRCKHCRHTADQLNQFNDQGLGVALAEAVLGWGGRAYAETRAAQEAADAPAPEAPVEAVARTIAGEPFFDTPPLPRTAPSVPGAPPAARAGGPAPTPRSRRRHSAKKAAARRRNLTAAVATAGALVVLPLVLWSIGKSDDTAPAAGARASDTPGTGTDHSTTDPTLVGSGRKGQGTLSGRIHNVDSGLCVAVAGKKAVKGAETEVTDCSSDAAQQWTYETDGLLRSSADPELCLDSHLGYSVQLAQCSGAGKAEDEDVRYDFTARGNLVPRWDQDLALTPAATDGTGALVLKSREDDSAVQRWVFDTSKADLQMEWVNWDAVTDPTPTPTPTPTPKKATPTPSPTPSTAAPTPSSPYPTDVPCYYTNSCGGDGQYGGGYGGGWGYGGYGGGGYGSGRR
ncbi:DNA-directed RNA polymerase specialized sigma24 family protein [Streptomyces sp. TLI_55]|uniref:ricin-type beta-trefoil lectin domain protein n=1 Tax=Streptomyces sp. TLI_55 TaxID=1938861 RepID=UPI000BD57DE3|nr:ricin-type beta-trefoil lectin domain protein [Streptomyces sp. TLI_55]SNX65673.1 DNA-directed RNA polymerase specialized sigma24 family protein [Streptomyces sp. TLI_55]